jgi:hypothetical protein
MLNYDYFELGSRSGRRAWRRQAKLQKNPLAGMYPPGPRLITRHQVQWAESGTRGDELAPAVPPYAEVIGHDSDDDWVGTRRRRPPTATIPQ